MSEVFVDASFWIAFRSKSETNHSRARAVIKDLRQKRARLLTTYLVFAEMHAAFSRVSELREQVIRDFTDGGPARIESIQDLDYAKGFALLAQHDDKSFSFCDAVSFVVMRRLRMRQALSFDDHFRQIGEFEILS